MTAALLITVQKSRLKELIDMNTRLKEKPRAQYNSNLVQMRTNTVEQIFNEARKAHHQIISLQEAEVDSYVEENIFPRIQTLYEDMSDFLMTLLSEIQIANEETLRAQPNDSASNASLCAGLAKLPRIDLPSFNGNYQDWDHFRDLFKALVHDVPNLPDSAKLNFLKSCMEGDAKEILKGVTPARGTYDMIWNALDARFKNPRFVVHNELRSLVNIPKMKEETAVGLRQFTDEAMRIVRVLGNMQMPVDKWDVPIVFLLSERLAEETHSHWENELAAKYLSTPLTVEEEDPLKPFPSFTEFSNFLEKRSRTLFMLASSSSATESPAASSSTSKGQGSSSSSHKPKAGSKRAFHVAFSQDDSKKCSFCSGTHRINKCPKFNAIPNPFDRREEARKLKLCFNCLGKHKFKDCKSQGRCSVCQNKHHSLIHYTSTNQQTPQAPSSGQNSTNNKTKESKSADTKHVHTARVSSVESTSVILATAKLTLIGPHGSETQVRALLDQGSETSFISETVVQILNLPRTPTSVVLKGLGEKDVGTARFCTQFTLQSLVDPSFKLQANALILQQLTARLPASRSLDVNITLFSKLSLADPEFNISDSIDVILGAEIYGQLLRSGLQQISSTSLVAQNTALGWIVSGPARSRRAARRSKSSTNVLHCTTRCDLDEKLQKFWELEEVPPPKELLTPNELSCEKLFKETHIRDPTGRFIVRLPLSSIPPPVAVETRDIASKSLDYIHRRFSRDWQYASNYREFMLQYELLGHMERVPDNEIDNANAWYIPHHAVVQSSPSKYKLRVVFDASRQTRERHRLNNFLQPGPALQRDLPLVILNWRRYKYGFTTDLVKMFRQIRVAPVDQDLQRILWSPYDDIPPVHYRLTTVTYGTTCAPYLAIRTLLQLAQDEKERYPLGSHCLESDIYVDDIFTGADDFDLALKTRNELIDIFASAGMNLDKWAANDPKLLPTRADDSQELVSIDSDVSVKTLGLQWNPKADEFRFTALGFEQLAGASTKRTVLSNIAKLFDPLGWVAPVTVTAKILMQDIWILKCDWDDTLPFKERERWLEYCRSLSHLPSLSIDRWLGTSSSSSATVQIHGFCDASVRAYAAAVYLRIDEGNGKVQISLLAAKSKVAPVKTKSIPHLELCGAVLLVKLLLHVQGLGFLQNLPVFCWSDSQIVLQWLKKHPSCWKTFVANRVSLIHTELPNAVWGHVLSGDNPADLATKGVKPLDLSQSKLWWQGARWLVDSSDEWPRSTPTQVLHVRPVFSEYALYSKYSDFIRLIRMTALCLRFVSLLQDKQHNLDRLPSYITVRELNKARIAIFKAVQLQAFSHEINLLKVGKPLPKRSRLLKLKPFIDKNDGLLRVGGRLSLSSLAYQQKHPPILPYESAVSRLLVRRALTTSFVIQRVWIIGLKRLVKNEIRHCVPCQRAHPQLAHQLMGDLPADRTTPADPFFITGLDYAGPFQIRAMKGRGHKGYKGYIALFICFTTRAIHLEAVDDLQSETFILAFRRFVGRRGPCRKLYSDNATTFQGADKELRSMFKAASEFYQETASSLANDGTDWTFIPPNTPHYGGLWEAGVKSVKNHLKRAIGDRSFTFFELSTILVEIEACLNSRPLSPLNADIEDLQALTPSHFLTFKPSIIVPDEEPPQLPENRLTRFHLLQVTRNKFWKRWSGEYMQHLQERSKWRSQNENFGVGQLVILRDDRYSPAKWPLARVTELHLGPDGVVRVVTVRTASSTFRRHIARLCPLHLSDQPQQKADTTTKTQDVRPTNEGGRNVHADSAI